MKFGCAIWTIRWAPPYEDAIRRIARLGFKCIELDAFDYKILYQYYTKKKIRELKELMNSLGLEHTEFVSTPRGQASLRKEDQEDAVRHFRRLVEAASEFETKIVNAVSLWPFHGVEWPNIKKRPMMQTFLMPKDLPYDTNFDKIWTSYVNITRRFCDIAEDAGLLYAIEPHPWSIISNADAMLRLIDQVGSKALGMNFDPSHLFPMGETPAVGVLKLRGRIFHMHISDNDAQTNAHWRPGKGKIDWVSVLKALKSIGYDYVLSLELEDAPGIRTEVRELGSSAEAAPVFDTELVKAMEFLRDVAKEAGVSIK